MDIDEFFRKQGEMNANGTLTVGEAIFGYYRLLSGEHAGRVIVKTLAKIDDQSICFFANGLTWTFTDKIKNIRCERVFPTFNQGSQDIDRSQAEWYNDGSSVKSHYTW